jgi:hypothetical protein
MSIPNGYTKNTTQLYEQTQNPTFLSSKHNKDLLLSPNPKTSLHFAKTNSTSSLQRIAKTLNLHQTLKKKSQTRPLLFNDRQNP